MSLLRKNKRTRKDEIKDQIKYIEEQTRSYKKSIRAMKSENAAKNFRGLYEKIAIKPRRTRGI